MAQEAAVPASATPSAPTQYIFHPRFGQKKRGDVILRAVKDEISFYFPRAILSAVSSFFAELPNPTLPEDTFDGTPVIPLPDATCGGTLVIVTVLKTMNNIDPVSEKELLACGAQGILEAVLAAKLYDCPIVIRLIIEALQNPIPINQQMIFAIYLFADLPAKAAAAAKAAADLDITRFDTSLVRMIKKHSPEDWMRLQDFALRRVIRLAQFHHAVEMAGGWYEHEHEACSDPEVDADRWVKYVLKRAKTVEAVEMIYLNAYGLRCSGCQSGTEQYDKLARELWQAASEY